MEISIHQQRWWDWVTGAWHIKHNKIELLYKAGDMFDLAGNHYPSRVLLEHIDIRHLKSQPQHKHAQQSISESMQITLSETIVALTILAVRCEKDFVLPWEICGARKQTSLSASSLPLTLFCKTKRECTHLLAKAPLWELEWSDLYNLRRRQAWHCWNQRKI